MNIKRVIRRMQVSFNFARWFSVEFGRYQTPARRSLIPRFRERDPQQHPAHYGCTSGTVTQLMFAKHEGGCYA